MCPSGATCLPIVVSVSYHYKNPFERVVLVQSGNHYRLIELICSRNDIANILG